MSQPADKLHGRRSFYRSTSARTIWLVIHGLLVVVRGIDFLIPGVEERLPVQIHQWASVFHIETLGIMWIVIGLGIAGSASTRYWVQGMTVVALLNGIWAASYLFAGSVSGSVNYFGIAVSALVITRMIDPGDIKTETE